MTVEQVRHLLYHESGLRAIAGTDDMRELLGRIDEPALLAVEIFCYRALKYVGAYLAILGGAEAIVFTGGIGEHSPEIRRRICDGLGWLGLTLDQQANGRGDRRISTPASKPGVFVLPAEEERVIAREAWAVLMRDGAGA
jgi:acetate kinase